MTSHPAVEDLAAQTDAAVAHAASCLSCARLLDEQREVSRMLGGLPAPVLRPSQRDALAAEVMARADQPAERATGPRHRAIAVIALGALAAAAAATFLVLRPPAATTDVPPAPVASSAPAIAPTVSTIVQPESAPPPAPVEAAPRVIALDRDDLTIDTRDAEPAKVVRGDTAIAVRDARVKVIAKQGVIAQVHVFAGSAQVTVGGTTFVVEQGVTWTRPEPPPVVEASPTDRSLAAFRLGWEKLRAGDTAAAIAELDKATDEVVAEDAMYWAAVAAERLGRADARARFERFATAFPQSPRIDAAKAALARLAPSD